MIEAPAHYCIVGRELYVRQFRYLREADVYKDTALGRNWEWAAGRIEAMRIDHAERCLKCRKVSNG